MELRGIKEFLERYKATLLKGDLERDEIVVCVKNISGVFLKNTEFTIRNKTLHLKVSAVKKNQIFLYKDLS